MVTSSLLPSIGSKEFNRLEFKDQLYIFSLYLSYPDKYREQVGLPRLPYPELLYVDENINYIRSNNCVGYPVVTADTKPVTIIKNHWAAYASYYSDKWYEEAFSPLDEFNISHRRVLSFQLFTFPLLSLDHTSGRIIRWLISQSPKKTSYYRDLLFYVVKLRASTPALQDPSNEDIREVWNNSVVKYDKVVDLQQLDPNGSIFKPDPDIVESLELEDLVLFYSKLQLIEHRYYIPIVPAELFNKSKFYIKYWGFLVS